MKKRLRPAFLAAYEELDQVCRSKFGVRANGVLAYVEQLNAVRFAPGRNTVLPRLVHLLDLAEIGESPVEIVPTKGGGSIRLFGPEVVRADIRWTKRFARLITKKRDPLSLYLRRARRRKRWRRFAKVFFPTLAVLLAIAAAVCYFWFR